MKKILFFLTFFVSLFSLNAAVGDAVSETPLFYRIDIDKEIGATTWRYMQKGYDEARKVGAEAIILRLNTYGGTVVHADSIRTLILNSSMPVYAFIDNNAASAGALIAISCDSIYMREGANIGAATVVNQTGEAMPISINRICVRRYVLRPRLRVMIRYIRFREPPKCVGDEIRKLRKQWSMSVLLFPAFAIRQKCLR